MEKLIKNNMPKTVVFAAIIIIIAGMMAAKTVLLPCVLALFISIICMKPILWLESKKINYTLAVIIVLIAIIVAFVSLGGVIGSSFSSFMNDLPSYQTKLDAKLAITLGKLDVLDTNIDTKLLLSQIEPSKLFEFTTVALAEVGRFLSDFFVILIITIFILLEAKGFVVKGRVLRKFYKISTDSFTRISDEVRNYLFIKTLISIGTGIFIWLWLLATGVDYPILWGVIAFLLNYIPNIGSILAAVPSVLLAVVQLGWGGALWTGLGYLLVNMIMGNIVEPKALGRGLGLSTLVVFLSLIVWGYIFGSVGMFLSVPLTITLKIMLEQNIKTRWIAILLGSEDDAKIKLGMRKKDFWESIPLRKITDSDDDSEE